MKVNSMSKIEHSYMDYINNPHLIYENDDAPKNKEDFISRLNDGERQFQGLKLPNSDLSGVNLSNLNLCGSDLSNCNLTETNFSSSILHASILTNSDFTDADMTNCDLSESKLSGAKFISSRLINVNLTDTECNSAIFINCDLSSSRLNRTSLLNSKFHQTNISEVYFESSLLLNTSFSQCELIDVKIIDTPLECFINGQFNEKYEIVIDWKSIAQSLTESNLEKFLISSGMPNLVTIYLIDSVKTLDPEMLFKYMQKVFISYGSPDVNFAKKLKNDLNKSGVNTWFFEDDADFGQKLHQMMRENINKYDRILLICSQESLLRPGVLNEIEQTLSREAREGGSSRIIPINLDNYIFSNSFKATDISQEILDRVAANFTNKLDYDIQFNKLLRTLRINKPNSIDASDNHYI